MAKVACFGLRRGKLLEQELDKCLPQFLSPEGAGSQQLTQLVPGALKNRDITIFRSKGTHLRIIFWGNVTGQVRVQGLQRRGVMTRRERLI
jgi:hypothetical protein